MNEFRPHTRSASTSELLPNASEMPSSSMLSPQEQPPSPRISSRPSLGPMIKEEPEPVRAQEDSDRRHGLPKIAIPEHEPIAEPVQNQPRLKSPLAREVESVYSDPEDYDNTAEETAVIPVMEEEIPQSTYFEEEEESPAERAARIRSFYREYFEESDYVPGQPIPQPDSGAIIYDPVSGRYVVTGDERPRPPPHRRAMTPPASMAPPRMPAAYHHPRSHSSASGRIAGHPVNAGVPKRPLRPLEPLSNLPSPHKLGRDAEFTALGFSRPKRVMTSPTLAGGDTASVRSGTSSHVPAPSPLKSSYIEIPDLPTPYMLRNSRTYSSLDFAPPRKFAQSDAGSDTGSIRSARTGVNLEAVSRGAGRVSRIPEGLVTTREGMLAMLKPEWEMREMGDRAL